MAMERITRKLSLLSGLKQGLLSWFYLWPRRYGQVIELNTSKRAGASRLVELVSPLTPLHSYDPQGTDVMRKSPFCISG